MKPLQHHQTDGLAFLRRRDWRGNLFMEPGTGKTRIGLEVAKRARRTLCVAPLNPAQYVWPEQQREWAPELRIDVVTGDDEPGKRYKRLIKDPPDLAVMNPALLHWLYDVVREKRKLPYDALLLDESTFAKNHDSVSFRVLKAIEHCFDAVIPMTGTPAENSLHDIWAPCYLVDRGKALGPNIGSFRERYFRPVMRENYCSWKVSRPAELRLAAAPLCFVRRTGDCVDMPELSFQDVHFALSSAERRLYQNLREEHVVDVDEPFTIENAGVELDKLRQVSSGFVYNPEGETIFLGDSKVKALEESIDEACGRPTLIGYWYRGSLERIRKKFGDVPVINRHTDEFTKRRLLRDWRRGRIPVLYGQIATVALGINMQSPEASVCFYDMPWSHGLHWQFIRRVWRWGQETRVVARRLIARATVDGYCASVLRKKQVEEENFMTTILEEELL